MTEAQLVELVRRYQAQLKVTAQQAARHVLEQWQQLGSWDEADVERLATEAGPGMNVLQAHASALTAAFVGLTAGLALRSVSPPSLVPSWRDPFIAYWGALKNGASWDQALTVGGSRAETVGFDAVQTTARETSQEIDTKEPRIVGWERVLTGVSCEWCAMVATQRYHTAESASFGHNNCDCSVVPITADANPGRVINHGLLSQLKSLPADQSTGYVNDAGDPVARPAATVPA